MLNAEQSSLPLSRKRNLLTVFVIGLLYLNNFPIGGVQNSRGMDTDSGYVWLFRLASVMFVYFRDICYLNDIFVALIVTVCWLLFANVKVH